MSTHHHSRLGRAAVLTAAVLIAAAVWASGAPAAFALDIQTQTVEGDVPPDKSLPQLVQSLDLAIHDQVAAAKTSFQFRNDFDRPLELTLMFALAPDEMVDGFAYWNGAEKIVGEVLEKQQAEQVYQQISKVQRRDPGLLEQVGDRFRLRVFPIAPQEIKPVELTSVATLEIREGVVEYVIPKENLPAPGVPFELDAQITDDLEIREVETVGFHAQVKRDGDHRVVINAEDADSPRDTDWAIRYTLDTDDYGLRLVAHKDAGSDGSFMLLVSPKTVRGTGDFLARDVVFVIDISGSMMGQPLEQTKAALEIVLGRLRDQDRFNVIAFDDQSVPFFEGLRPATPANVGEAVNRTRHLETRGGTNIKGALATALDQFATQPRGHARAVVFLTDGQGDAPPEQVLAEVRSRDTDARVYSFGAGNGVNRRFLERLARENRGITTFIQRPEDIQREITRIDDRIAMPLMVDLDVEFDGLDVHSVYPQRLPDLYRDGQVVVLGRYAEGSKGTIRVTGTLKNRKQKLLLRVELPDDEPDFGYVEKLWAGRRITQLTDTIQMRGTEGAGVDELILEVTRLGIVHNIVTDYTTFLAVPESLKTTEVKEAIKNGKMGYDKKIIDSLDGVKLSQSFIPPGDPVLTVLAPREAKSVTAYFPFGLVKPLRWDDARGRWSARFLVPRHVNDGVYTIRIRIVHADGRVEWKTVDYVIDATEPEFLIDAPDSAYPSDEWPIAVDPFEPVASVEVYVDGGTKPVKLQLDPDTGLYFGRVPMPAAFENGQVTVRVVVRDLARNRFEQEMTVRDESLIEHDEHENLENPRPGASTTARSVESETQDTIGEPTCRASGPNAGSLTTWTWLGLVLSAPAGAWRFRRRS